MTADRHRRSFEHRNYFLPWVAAGGRVAPGTEPGIQLRIAPLIIADSSPSRTTFLRAQEWSDPIGLAYSEALKRPNSPRAQHELGRILIIARKNRNSPLIVALTEARERNAYLPAKA